MRIVLAVAIALTMAGCLGSSESGNDEARDPEAAHTPGLDAAPQWEIGDWWTYRFTATPFNDYEATGTIVVADVTDDAYMVGMPTESFDDFMFTFHFPPMGEISRTDLSYEIHNGPFKVIGFPLTNETSWETDVVGYKGQAQVEVTTPTTASIVIEPFLAPLRAEYDATVGHFTRIGIDDYGYADLIDYGSGWKGNVSVPVNQQTIFYGRAAGAVAIDDPLFMVPSQDPNQPDTGVNPAPVDVVTLPDRQYLGLVQWVGTFFLVPESSPGLFIERAEAPNGQVYEIQRDPADGEGTDMQWFRIEDPGGEWTFTHSAAGAGIATSEGIVYDLKNFLL